MKIVISFLVYNKIKDWMNDLEKILKLENYKIIKIEERSENNKMIKVIYVESKNKKDKCPQTVDK